jgi:hypothetical protein
MKHNGFKRQIKRRMARDATLKGIVQITIFSSRTSPEMASLGMFVLTKRVDVRSSLAASMFVRRRPTNT